MYHHITIIVLILLLEYYYKVNTLLQLKSCFLMKSYVHKTIFYADKIKNVIFQGIQDFWASFLL